MTKIQAWVRSFRLRTLPLSSAGAIMGAALAYKENQFSWIIATLCLLTILLLQILANLANDLGDYQKGTDNIHRAGPIRSIQSGIITEKEMTIGIALCIFFILVSGISLLFYSFQSINLPFLIFLAIGIIGIGAAIKYTVGKKAYGYYGLGDLFVFIFFGFLPVTIAYYLQTNFWDWSIILPGFIVGLLSTAVLNLNNLRDYKNDKNSNKKTLIVNIGIHNGKIYHTFLLVVALICSFIYLYFEYNCPYNLLYLIAFLPLSFHLIKVWRTTEMKKLDPELKKVALSTIFMVILWSIGIFVCS